MIYPAWIIKKPRYIKEKCCISNLKGKRVYTLSGHLVGEIVQPVLSLGKINGWLITPDRRYHLDKSVFILHKEIIAIGEIVFVHRRVSEYLHNYNEMHKEKIHIEKTFTENKKIKEYAKKISIKKQQANHRKLEEIILRVAENLNKKFKKRVEKAKDNIFYFVVWLKNKLNRKEDKKEILYERVL
jgi:sporulation protein YlmC with PRC-barrel domain